MNWQLIEQPRIKKETPHLINSHVLNGIDAAARCVRWLKAQGFIVLGVQIGKRNPRIEIAPSRLCDGLEGAIYLTERRCNQATTRGWVALRFDCEVRWMDREVA